MVETIVMQMIALLFLSLVDLTEGGTHSYISYGARHRGIGTTNTSASAAEFCSHIIFSNLKKNAGLLILCEKCCEVFGVEYGIDPLNDLTLTSDLSYVARKFKCKCKDSLKITTTISPALANNPCSRIIFPEDVGDYAKMYVDCEKCCERHAMKIGNLQWPGKENRTCICKQTEASVSDQRQ